MFLPSLAAALVLASSPASALQVLAVYDWSTATANALLDDEGVGGDNNDGWVNAGGGGTGIDDFVRDTGQPVGFSGNFFSSEGSQDDTYLRPNDGTFGYAIPSSAETIVLSYVLTMDSVDFALVGLFGPALTFGATSPGFWGVRGSDGVKHESVATGAAALDATTRSYRATLTLDMTPIGTTKLAALVVENLSDGGAEQILSNQPVELGLTDPALWDQLFLRVNDQAMDDFTIAVPEPGASALIAFVCLTGAAAGRRVRRAR
ncbi:MAG: hypothetical protein HKP30_00755 [Myxococcales bacterium]|nr:hypothetical protein [Myxococcales bacterium]